MLPTVVVMMGEADADEGAPFWALGLADKLHASLVRQTIAFARVAGNARANNVLPGGLTAAISRQDMIEVEIIAVENLPAILAGVLVPLKDVMSRKFHLFFRKPVKNKQNDHPGDSNVKGDRADHVRLGVGTGKIPPAPEIMRQKVLSILGANYLGVALVK